MVVMVLSCSKDKDDSDYSYSFKNQTLQGKINGVEWTFVAGNCDDSYADDTYSADLYPAALEDPCDWAFENDRILMSIPTIVGLKELSFDFHDFENSYTVTLYATEGSLNTVATKGAVEVLSLTDSTLTGRMDVYADGDNYVNGNFTIQICSGL